VEEKPKSKRLAKLGIIGNGGGMGDLSWIIPCVFLVIFYYPKTNMEPENDVSPKKGISSSRRVHFRLHVSFRGVYPLRIQVYVLEKGFLHLRHLDLSYNGNLGEMTQPKDPDMP